MKSRIASLAVPLLLAAVPATAQITTVPMKGVGNEWVKSLELQGRMNWEWIETYPEVVYFVTRPEAEQLITEHLARPAAEPALRLAWARVLTAAQR